ncbi:hypothetical protein Nmel_008603, partial [Mimus melanotis]
MSVLCCNKNLHYEQLPYETAKELRGSVKENGLHSSFTTKLLNAIAEVHTMSPVDWKSLFKTILTGGQYSVWWMEFSLRKVPDTKMVESGFAAVRQGPQERYITFINQLQSTVRGPIDMEEAADAVLKSFAYENANNDYKKSPGPN